MSSPLSPRKEKREVFIAPVITLQEVKTETQTFELTGFINAMWRCPDLEDEDDRKDYYPKHNENGEAEKMQVKRQLEQSEDAGYVRKSVAAGVVRKYVTGFQLSTESDVLPFDPQKMFEDRRIVPGSFALQERTYYYYPMAHNTVEAQEVEKIELTDEQERAGKTKEQVLEEATSNESTAHLVRAASGPLSARCLLAHFPVPPPRVRNARARSRWWPNSTSS
jgi:hypothetical protein